MNIAFTICSNNYLAQAKTLMDSVYTHNPDFKLFIGLVDKKIPEIDYNFFQPAEIIEIEDIGIPSFNTLVEKYDIIELNTSVKASLIKYLKSKNKNAKILFYIDPDIKVYGSFSELEKNLDRYSIVLTPHILTPIPLDGKKPDESVFLNHGIYNLGFLGLNLERKQTQNLLDWWEERLLSMCYRQTAKGIFVDQLWLSLANIFYSEAHVIRKFGYNMAPWNLHERKIIRYDQAKHRYILNDGSGLIFYHFSSYNFKKPEDINRPYYNRYTFQERQDLIPLYEDYHQDLLANKVHVFSALTCYYYPRIDSNKEKVLVKKHPLYKKILKQLIPPLIYNTASRLKNIINA